MVKININHLCSRGILLAAAIGLAAATLAATVDLSTVRGDTVLQDGDVATGTLGGNYKISVADGATVTLRNAVIDQDSGWDGWASVNCLGGATIVLEGDNTLNSKNSRYPAIHIPTNKTLTVRGSGSLAAWGGNGSAAIGGGNGIDCGNIVIAGGTITVTVLGRTAGIGSGSLSTCGNITISGGTITTGVKDSNCMWSTGIGAGAGGSCGDILISGGTVYAQGKKSTGIGSGYCSSIYGRGSSCGSITISGGNVTAISDDGAAAIGSAKGIEGDSGEPSYYSVCGDITISGGTVNATILPATLREYSCVGIGPGCISAVCGNITIGLGITSVTATSVYPGYEGELGIPIGAAEGGSGTCGTIVVDPRLVDATRETAVTANPEIRTMTRTIEPRIIHLDDLPRDMLFGNELIVRDGSILTGVLKSGYKVSIWKGATVTLRNACIEQIYHGDYWDVYPWAGITCRGDATIILEGEGANTVMGFNEDDPGIYVPVGKTLTIRGDGILDAFPGHQGCGAAIGASTTNSCGNIVIESGTIFASVSGRSGHFAAGIGGTGADCGFIEIKGGNVTALGGEGAAGIGGGLGGRCRGISIGSGIETVVATAGYDCDNPIGAGNDGSCGGVVMGFGLKSVAGTDNEDRKTSTITHQFFDLSDVTENTTISNNSIVIGSHTGTNKICIADGATVMLRNVSINAAGHNYSSTPWAGITCLGDATIILDEENLVKGCNEYWPGIYVPENKTLTIRGEGALTAAGSGFYGAGIGGGQGNRSCGTIVIAGGTITATGGGFGAGIGSGFQSLCDGITINGGTITATGGSGAAGIGGGNDGDCGSISITGGAVDATGGADAAGIGSGICYEYGGCCGYITIGPNIALVVAKAGNGCENPIGADDEDMCAGVSVSTYLTDNHGKPTRRIEGGGIPAYGAWAAANGIAGAWNEKDASGIYNVFRYAFNKPTDDFTIIDITFNEAGKVVVGTPPLVNGGGFVFSVVASDTPDGTGNVATTPLDPSGETTINETGKTARFFRLTVTEE